MRVSMWDSSARARAHTHTHRQLSTGLASASVQAHARTQRHGHRDEHWHRHKVHRHTHYTHTHIHIHTPYTATPQPSRDTRTGVVCTAPCVRVVRTSGWAKFATMVDLPLESRPMTTTVRLMLNLPHAPPIATRVLLCRTPARARTRLCTPAHLPRGGVTHLDPSKRREPCGCAVSLHVGPATALQMARGLPGRGVGLLSWRHLLCHGATSSPMPKARRTHTHTAYRPYRLESVDNTIHPSRKIAA